MWRFPEGPERDRGGKMTTCHVLFRAAKQLCHEGSNKAEGAREINLSCFHHKYMTSFR